jgi:GT2 family glycosyltransferase
VQNIIDKFKDKLNIKFLKNDNNLGHGRNFLKAVSIANGKYVWTLGNDDLLVPHAIEKILNLLKLNTHIDFFFINSYNLHSKYIFSFLQPFDTANLPKKMDKYCSYNKNKQMNFFSN